MKRESATDGENEWYERERSAFIVWWEAEGQKKFSGAPTIAAGAGWLARAEAASTASETVTPMYERRLLERAASVLSCSSHPTDRDLEKEIRSTLSATRGLIRDCAEPSISRADDKNERCPHGVWLADHCWTCEPNPIIRGKATPSATRANVMGDIFCKYVDRLNDPVPFDRVEKVVAELMSEVNAFMRDAYVHEGKKP